jgi:hypothetical protein
MVLDNEELHLINVKDFFNEDIIINNSIFYGLLSKNGMTDYKEYIPKNRELLLDLLKYLSTYNNIKDNEKIYKNNKGEYEIIILENSLYVYFNNKNKNSLFNIIKDKIDNIDKDYKNIPKDYKNIPSKSYRIKNKYLLHILHSKNYKGK